MRERSGKLALTGLLVVCTMIMPIAAQAGPVATDDATYDALGRVFPEIDDSTHYTTFTEFVPAIQHLEQRYPDRLNVFVYGQSVLGRDLYAVELTNELSPVAYEDRKKVVLDVSMHGSERSPTEGTVRFLEDMASSDDPDDIALLDTTVAMFSFPNPDGWVQRMETLTPIGLRAGTRGNINGVDINRTFPSIGYLRSEWRPQTEPESIAHKALLDRPEYASAAWGHSLHCYTVNTRSYVQLLWMAGQNDLAENVQSLAYVNRLGDEMAAASAGLEFSSQNLLPVMHGTVWETRRSINTGFAGGYMAHPAPAGQDKLGIAFEQWNCENANWNQATQRYHVEGLRAALRVSMEAANEEKPDVRVHVPGVVGYLVDDAVVTHDDENGVGYEPANDYDASFEQYPYRATRMQFFEDLREYTPRLAPVPVPAASAPGRLGSLSAFVVTEHDGGVNPGRLKSYVEGGGTLVLTDGALRTLPKLVDLPESAILQRQSNVARMNASSRDFSHPLLAGLNSPEMYAEQLFEPVPLGFQLSPARTRFWGVNVSAFEAAGGRIAARDNLGSVMLGDIDLGDGRIVVIGGLLPQPTEEFFHPYGLADYSVTYTGYQVLLNALGATLEIRD